MKFLKADYLGPGTESMKKIKKSKMLNIMEKDVQELTE